MSAAHAARAFDRFWRLDPGRAGFGSGLGLSIVPGIVEAHAEAVELISAQGVGATVRVRLPLSGAAKPRRAMKTDLGRAACSVQGQDWSW